MRDFKKKFRFSPLNFMPSAELRRGKSAVTKETDSKHHACKFAGEKLLIPLNLYSPLHVPIVNRQIVTLQQAILNN
jgi:hypothetical protein